MEGNYRLLIVDDHNLVCNGLKIVIGQTDLLSDNNAIDTAYSGEEGVIKALTFDYDLILMDVQMPEMNGIEATKRIIKEKPESKIVALSMHDDMSTVNKMLGAGASGYLLKDSGVEKLIKGIRTVIQGGRFFSNRIALKLIELDKNSTDKESGGDDVVLTNREKEILSLIFNEFTNVQIGEKLSISKRTVDAHRLNILKKLGVKNTAGLIKFAMARGYS